MISNKVFSGKENCKYFIGYKVRDDFKIKQSD